MKNIIDALTISAFSFNVGLPHCSKSLINNETSPHWTRKRIFFLQKLSKSHIIILLCCCCLGFDAEAKMAAESFIGTHSIKKESRFERWKNKRLVKRFVKKNKITDKAGVPDLTAGVYIFLGIIGMIGGALIFLVSSLAAWGELDYILGRFGYDAGRSNLVDRFSLIDFGIFYAPVVGVFYKSKVNEKRDF